MFTFTCSSCGLCCKGWLPLTLSEALVFATQAPLAVVWMVHRRTKPPHPAFRGAARMFPVIAGQGPDLVPWVRSSVFVPPDTPCLHLVDGRWCGIHATKPLRCRTMPFHSTLPMEAQEAHLKPKEGWPCFNPPGGEELYDQGRFLAKAYRDDYVAEIRALEADAPVMRRHVNELVNAGKASKALLAQVAATPGGFLVRPWSSLVPHLLDAGTPVEALRVALEGQARVLADWRGRAVPAAYLDHYRDFAADVAVRADSISAQVSA